MTTARLALVSLASLALTSPALAGDKEQLRAIGQGRALFLVHCASCHGANARGLEGVPDLTRIEARDGVFDPVHVAWHVDGRRRDAPQASRMPRWGDSFARTWPRGESAAVTRVWALTRYLDFVQEPSPGGCRSRIAR
jgi:mono/diheme cytochrome c family protein